MWKLYALEVTVQFVWPVHHFAKKQVCFLGLCSAQWR